MAYAAMKPTKPGLEETPEQIQKINITISSKNVKNLEKVCAELVRGAKDKRLRVKGYLPRFCTLQPGSHPVEKVPTHGIDLSCVGTSVLLISSALLML